jgi:hypothetical protein
VRGRRCADLSPMISARQQSEVSISASMIYVTQTVDHLRPEMQVASGPGAAVCDSLPYCDGASHLWYAANTRRCWHSQPPASQPRRHSALALAARPRPRPRRRVGRSGARGRWPVGDRRLSDKRRQAVSARPSAAPALTGPVVSGGNANSNRELQ